VIRAELRGCILLALLLVFLRSAVWMFWEASLNSDHAVVGLMAKHLSEFRAFPLFFYGQNYMLGVQSWIAVPFFWLAGPTVAMLRLPLVLINAGVAVAFVMVLTRCGLRPFHAFVASLPFIVTSPIVSDALLETLGASVEPFAYILLLWALRTSPAWFGALFCVAHLHREFVVFAAPALAAAQWLQRRWWTPAQIGRAVAAFAGVWIVIDILKRTVNAYGPAGGDYVAAPLSLQAQQILKWLSLEPGPYFGRLRHAVAEALPDMLGASRHSLSRYGVLGGLDVGSAIAGVALGVAVVLCVMRLASQPRGSHATPASDAFVLYVGLIGFLTLLAYGLNTGISPGDPPVVRYLLFTLLLPVALLAHFFLREQQSAWRTGVVALVCTWAMFNVVDNVRLVRQYIQSPPPHPHRQIADYLVAENIRYARAGYWDAYAITFLSAEKVIVASAEKVRVTAYQTAVAQNSSNAVTLWRQPCDYQPQVSEWCVKQP
jgi:hypothetical protein